MQSQCLEGDVAQEQVQREDPEVTSKASGHGLPCLILEVLTLKHSRTWKEVLEN